MLITESKLNRDRHLHPFVTILFVHTHTRSAVHSNQIETEDHSELRSSLAPISAAYDPHPALLGEVH